MGTLTLTLPDGRSGTLNVDDGFASMSEADKADFIDHVQGQLAPHQSFSSDIQGGLHDLGSSISTGANALGTVANSAGLPGVGGALQSGGKWVEGVTPSAPPGPSPGEEMASNLKAGNYGAALGNLPHAVVRALPSTAPILAGAALGGPVAAGGVAAAEALGPTAAARAANNNRDMTTSDVAASLPNAAAQGVLGAVLPGGAAEGIANPVLRAGARATIEGAAGGGMDLANQVGTTAGTAKGTTVDPYEVASSAATQGGLGAARGARELAAVGIKSAADNVMASRLPTPDLETAKSVTRVVQDANAVQQQRQTAGQPVTMTDAMNAVKDARVDELKRFIATAALDRADTLQLNNTIDAAQRSNNTLTDGQLDHVNSLDIDPAAKQSLIENLRDLNTASTQSFKNRETGPFRMLGNAAGRIAAVGGAALTHDPMTIGAALMGGGLEGKMGAGLGGMLDRGMGTNTPPVVLQAIKARRALQAAGIDPASLARTGMPEMTPPAPPPARAPGFIAPNGMGNVMNPTPQPAAPNPAPGFIRPPMPQAPAPAQAPGFIRPQGQMPGIEPPAPAPSGGTAPNPINIMMRAKAGAQLRPPEPGTPDPMTGNAPDAVPVNTPLKASFPVPQKAPLPSQLTPNTPQDVASAVAADNMAQPQDVRARLAEVSQAEAARSQAAEDARSAPPISGAMDYIKRGLPGMSPDQITAALQAHETAGRLAPGTVADLQTAPKVLPHIGAQLQQLAAVGIPTGPAGGSNQGYAVEHSVQARVNASGYQQRAATYAQIALSEGKPELAQAITAVAGEKSISGKRLLAAQYASSHSDTIPQDLLNQGKKD